MLLWELRQSKFLNGYYKWVKNEDDLAILLFCVFAKVLLQSGWESFALNALAYFGRQIVK